MIALTPAREATFSTDLELLEFSAKIATAPEALTASAVSWIFWAVASCWALKSDREALRAFAKRRHRFFLRNTSDTESMKVYSTRSYRRTNPPSKKMRSN